MRRSICAAMVATLAFSRPGLAQADWVRDLLLAAQLPVIALEARNDGIPNNEIGSILEAVRRAGLPAREAVIILDTTRMVRREYGPTDNFGAFVQSQLASGKRGTSLAAAIRAEHVRMGKGRGNAAGRGSDQDAGRGNPAAGRGRANDGARGGSPGASRGQSGNRGKPPEAGGGRGATL